MSLRIGEVSQLFGISIETLRFYDKEGIVVPGRRDNKYRSYDIWDTLIISEAVRYKSMNFSLKEVSEIQKKYDLKELDEMIIQKYNELQNSISYQQKLLKYLHDYHERIASVTYNINNYWIKMEPRMYQIICLESIGEQYPDLDIHNETLQQFLQTSPFYNGNMIIKLEDIQNNIDKRIWAFQLEEEHFKMFDIPLTDDIFIEEPKLCVHTIIDIGDKNEVTIGHFKAICDYIQSRNLTIIGDFNCEILARVHENNKWHRYLEVKVPIKK